MNKKQENLYDTNREYWMDIQLSTTKCHDCQNSMNPMESIPVKTSDRYTGFIGKGDEYIFICPDCNNQDNWAENHVKFMNERRELVEHINKLNEQSKATGAVGTLTNDLDHWAGYGVFNIGQFQLYLEREYEHNLRKDERRNQ